MSTHDIDFYEDLTKIIFELSSNIIKYAPYFFCFVTLYNYHAFAEFHYITRNQVFSNYSALLA